MKRVPEKVPNKFFEPNFWWQISEDCASNSACIGEIMWMTHSESMGAKTIEPDRMSSDLEARLPSDSFNWAGYIVSSCRIWVANHRFFSKTATLTVISVPLFNSWFWFKITNRESGNRSWRQGIEEMQKSRKPEIQKSRNPEMLLACHVMFIIVLFISASMFVLFTCVKKTEPDPESDPERCFKILKNCILYKKVIENVFMKFSEYLFIILPK